MKKAGKETTKERGITLIALVITIIILLILAAVTIAALSGENGILSNASKAKEETEIANEKEQISLAYMGAVAEKEGNGEVTSEDMNYQFGSNGTKAQASENINVEFTESKRWYKISTDGSIKGPYEEGEIPKSKTLVEMYEQAEAEGCLGGESCTNPEEHLHIGDYVDYKNPTSGTYPVQSEKSGVAEVQTYDVANNQLNWRVLGIDKETGGIKLIAGSPMKKEKQEKIEESSITTYDAGLEYDPYLYLEGAEAYVYGPEEMNNICAMYKNEYAEEARSIEMEDINQALGITNEEQIKANNAMVASGSIQYKEPYGPFENQYTPESYLNGKTRTTVEGEVSAYAFSIGNEAGQVSVNNERLKEMLFDNVELEKGKAYWIASRSAGAVVGEDRAYFGPNVVTELKGIVATGIGYYMFFSNGYEDDGGLAVRPVVSLKSEISEEQVPKIEDKVEEEWNYNGNSGEPA